MATKFKLNTAKGPISVVISVSLNLNNYDVTLNKVRSTVMANLLGTPGHFTIKTSSCLEGCSFFVS